MNRSSRSQFAAWGLLPLVNVLALLLHGLNLSTRSTDGSGRVIPALLVIAGIVVLTSFIAAIPRGRDVGLPGVATFLGCFAALFLGPLALVFYGYLALARGNAQGDRFGPPARPAGVLSWLLALVSLAWPWMALLVAGQVMR
ncbi:MAG: DUF805 domain-containing protein [Burkholderiaceae bacterium]